MSAHAKEQPRKKTPSLENKCQGRDHWGEPRKTSKTGTKLGRRGQRIDLEKELRRGGGRDSFSASRKDSELAFGDPVRKERVTGRVKDGGRGGKKGRVPAWPNWGKEEKEATDPKPILQMGNAETSLGGGC